VTSNLLTTSFSGVQGSNPFENKTILLMLPTFTPATLNWRVDPSGNELPNSVPYVPKAPWNSIEMVSLVPEKNLLEVITVTGIGTSQEMGCSLVT